ncbi:MAG: PilZ domain-containing protein [PVC group bacterium]|nr:PilZ domain-containing protein [PVC group bacterium]
MEEDRKFGRLISNLKVTWRKIDGFTWEKLNENKDISEQGICLIVDERVEAGDDLLLKIELFSGSAIRAIGKVVWISEAVLDGDKVFNAGIKFLDIDKDDRKEIAEFVFRNLRNKLLNQLGEEDLFES